jgi:hypothetical protein
MRFPEPYFETEDGKLERYLSELVRQLQFFDNEIFREDLGVLYETSRKHNIVEVCADYAMGKNDVYVLANTAAAAIVVSIPAAASAYRRKYTVKNTNTANTVSIEGSGTEFPYVLPAGSTSVVSFISDGNNFWVIK